MKNVFSVFLVFFRLGLTSFGGPVAHLAYFRDEFVERKKWLNEQSYADLVALCQFLPGPASSQVGMALGMHKAGFGGLFAAWIGFTLPSAVLLIVFALGITHYSEVLNDGVLQGLKIVALIVVIQAVWSMGKKLCPDTPRITIMVMAASVVLLLPTISTQVMVLLVAGIVGSMMFKDNPIGRTGASLTVNVSKTFAGVCLLLFFTLLVGLPIFAELSPNYLLTLVDIFYRAGSLVFGGGHVVLPLLQTEVVPNLIDNQTFLAGYGATQAVPGPLFTFSAFLGAAIPNASVDAVWFGFLCLTMIFVPSFLMVVGVLPFWLSVQKNSKIKSALLGVNAAVVGILLAALFNPIWLSSIQKTEDFVFALIVFVTLFFWKLPIWLIVIGGASLGGIFSVL